MIPPMEIYYTLDSFLGIFSNFLARVPMWLLNSFSVSNENHSLSEISKIVKEKVLNGFYSIKFKKYPPLNSQVSGMGGSSLAKINTQITSVVASSILREGP